jgi:glycosyltransferase involved in cell wall biosynthesis
MNILIFEPECSGHRMYLYTSVLVKNLILSGHNILLVTAPGNVDKVKAHFDIERSLTIVETRCTVDQNSSKFINKVINQIKRFVCFYLSIRKYSKIYGVERVFVPFFDDIWKAYVLFDWIIPIPPISGILLKANFFRIKADTNFDAIRKYTDTLLIKRALKCHSLIDLFMLDESAIHYLNGITGTVEHKKLVYLPDIGTAIPVTEDVILTRHVARHNLNLDTGQKVILMFGDISFRKGLVELVDLVENSEYSSSITALIVGRPGIAENNYLISKINLIDTKKIILILNFIPEGDVNVYFSACDVVWLGYKHFMHSSGVLIQAAHFNRPSLGCEIGMIGEDISFYGLGEIIDINDQKDMLDKLRVIVTRDYSDGLNKYKEIHKTENFMNKVVSRLRQC